jgi:hypothetical protein
VNDVTKADTDVAAAQPACLPAHEVHAQEPPPLTRSAEGRRGPCRACGGEVLARQVESGQWITLDPEPVADALRDRLPDDALWTVEGELMVRPGRDSMGELFVWHYWSCPAANPDVHSRPLLTARPRPMRPEGPNLPETTPMHAVPVPAPVSDRVVIDAVACGRCGAAPGSSCVTKRGWTRESHSGRVAAYHRSRMR